MTPPLHPTITEASATRPGLAQFRAEVLADLAATPKSIPPKYFYDAEGSRLFDAITDLEEYYPTRTETAIMEAHAGAMADLLGPRVRLIEFGSGSSVKTRILLDHLHDPAGYVPIDISAEHLADTAARLQQDYPDLAILPVAADYSQPFTLPVTPTPAMRTVVYFPGSTIGNMEPSTARGFLRKIHALIVPNGALLIGVDLRKDPALLIPAYNDALGVTAAFNRNLLVRINRELGADFRLDSFQHRALWNPEASRIEMHLISLARQVVHVDGQSFQFEPGESICTEYSYKYTLDSFATLAESAQLKVEHVWTDERPLFSVQYLLPE